MVTLYGDPVGNERSLRARGRAQPATQDDPSPGSSDNGGNTNRTNDPLCSQVGALRGGRGSNTHVLSDLCREASAASGDALAPDSSASVAPPELCMEYPTLSDPQGARSFLHLTSLVRGRIPSLSIRSRPFNWLLASGKPSTAFRMPESGYQAECSTDAFRIALQRPDATRWRRVVTDHSPASPTTTQVANGNALATQPRGVRTPPFTLQQPGVSLSRRQARHAEPLRRSNSTGLTPVRSAYP